MNKGYKLFYDWFLTQDSCCIHDTNRLVKDLDIEDYTNKNEDIDIDEYANNKNEDLDLEEEEEDEMLNLDN